MLAAPAHAVWEASTASSSPGDVHKQIVAAVFLSEQTVEHRLSVPSMFWP